MSTFYRSINPTSSDNVSSGYPLGSIWINTITYSGYIQDSNVVSNGIIRQCINGDGTIVNS